MDREIRVFDYYSPEDWVQKEDENGFFEDKSCIRDEVHGGVANFSYYPTGYFKHFHRHSLSHATYVIDGTLKTEEGEYGKGTFVWDPEGYCGGHGALPDGDCKFIWISNKAGNIFYLDPADRPEGAEKIQTQVSSVYDSDGWEDRQTRGGRIQVKPLVKDPETGMAFWFVRFPANYSLPLHTLRDDSALFVIDGMWTTPLWTVGPNKMQQIPGGYRLSSGAGADGCTFFLVTYGSAELEYVQER